MMRIWIRVSRSRLGERGRDRMTQKERVRERESVKETERQRQRERIKTKDGELGVAWCRSVSLGVAWRHSSRGEMTAQMKRTANET